MPISYEVDPSRRLMLLRGHGVLSMSELAEARARGAADPAFDASYATLVDFRGVTAIDRRLRLIRELAERPVVARNARLAILPPPRQPWGLARLFVAYAQLMGRPVEIFTDVEEAERWLGVPPGASS